MPEVYFPVILKIGITPPPEPPPNGNGEPPEPIIPILIPWKEIGITLAIAVPLAIIYKLIKKRSGLFG